MDSHTSTKEERPTSACLGSFTSISLFICFFFTVLVYGEHKTSEILPSKLGQPTSYSYKSNIEHNSQHTAACFGSIDGFQCLTSFFFAVLFCGETSLEWVCESLRIWLSHHLVDDILTVAHLQSFMGKT